MIIRELFRKVFQRRTDILKEERAVVRCKTDKDRVNLMPILIYTAAKFEISIIFLKKSICHQVIYDNFFLLRLRSVVLDDGLMGALR